MRRDLFVCISGEIRSPLAAEIARQLAEKNGILDYQADYIGIDTPAGKMLLSTPSNNFHRIFPLQSEIADMFKDRGHSPEKIQCIETPRYCGKTKEEYKQLLTPYLTRELEPYFNGLSKLVSSSPS